MNGLADSYLQSYLHFLNKDLDPKESGGVYEMFL